MCFVDFKKAFDSISHDKLWVTMMDMGYPLHLTDLLAKLYRKQLATVKVEEHYQNGFQLRKESDKVVSFLRTCSNPSGHGDEGDSRCISRWTTNWRSNDHEPLLR